MNSFNVWVAWMPIDANGRTRQAPYALVVKGEVWARYERRHMAERARAMMISY